AKWKTAPLVLGERCESLLKRLRGHILGIVVRSYPAVRVPVDPVDIQLVERPELLRIPLRGGDEFAFVDGPVESNCLRHVRRTFQHCPTPLPRGKSRRLRPRLRKLVTGSFTP